MYPKCLKKNTCGVFWTWQGYCAQEPTVTVAACRLHKIKPVNITLNAPPHWTVHWMAPMYTEQRIDCSHTHWTIHWIPPTDQHTECSLPLNNTLTQTHFWITWCRSEILSKKYKYCLIGSHISVCPDYFLFWFLLIKMYWLRYLTLTVSFSGTWSKIAHWRI